MSPPPSRSPAQKENGSSVIPSGEDKIMSTYTSSSTDIYQSSPSTRVRSRPGGNWPKPTPASRFTGEKVTGLVWPPRPASGSNAYAQIENGPVVIPSGEGMCAREMAECIEEKCARNSETTLEDVARRRFVACVGDTCVWDKAPPPWGIPRICTSIATRY